MFAVRLHGLCIARICCGVVIRWAHVSGLLDISDALAAHAERSEVRGQGTLWVRLGLFNQQHSNEGSPRTIDICEPLPPTPRRRWWWPF